MNNPSILGNAIVNIAISEKTKTAPKLEDEPIIIKIRKMIMRCFILTKKSGERLIPKAGRWFVG